MINRNLVLGIGTGVAICAAGIAYPASVGVGAAALLVIGGYALATGILTGAAALGAAALMVGAGILIGRSILRGEAPGQRLPWGGSA